MKIRKNNTTTFKNFVEEKPEGYEELGKYKEGCHSIAFFIKGNKENIEDIKFRSTKRCLTLLKIANFVSEKIKEKRKVAINDEEVLKQFSHVKKLETVKNRLNIVKKALGI